MHTFFRSRLRSSLALLVGLALISVVAAGCGSSSSKSSTSASSSSGSASGSSSLAALAKTVKAYTVAPSHVFPTQPVGKPIPTGQTIVYVNCGQPACTSMGTSLTAAAQVLGWKVTDINVQPTPESVQNGFQQAVRDHPDGVASAGFPASEYRRQVAELKALHIPVLSLAGTDATGTNGIALQIAGPSSEAEAAKMLADQALLNAKGTGEYAVVLLTGYPILVAQAKGWQDEIKAKCPPCTQKELTLQPTTIGTTAASSIANFLRANPGVNGVLLTYDLLGEGLKQAVANTGGPYPDTYSWAPDSPGREALETGERTGAVPLDYDSAGWQMADAFARLSTNQSIAPDSGWERLVLWSSQYHNAPSSASATPVVIANYQAQYKKLWGK